MRVLHAGTFVGGACLLMGLVLEVLGRTGSTGSLLDVRSVVGGVAELDPWGWSALGVWVVIATPGVALVATASEYRSIGDRRAVAATLLVVALLVLSLAVGIARGG
jgi:uncharacterized membrane protein